MTNWSVWISIRSTGKCPFDKWRASKALTKRDEAAIDAKVLTIESWSGPQLPPETIKDYLGSNLKELKARGDKKELRPLCIVDQERKIIILSGAIEKDSSIPAGDIKASENLREEYLSDSGTLKRYFED